MTETPALKPCPFCGGIASYQGNRRPLICCANEDCFGPATTAGQFPDAVEQWNARAYEAERDELIALKAMMQDPEAVRVNILCGTVARPNDLIFKYDENGDYTRLATESKAITDGLSALIGKVTNAQIDMSTGKTKAQVDAALTEALRDARATLAKVKQ